MQSSSAAGELLALDAAFEVWANDGQIEPVAGGWNTWLMMAGRGFGKTRAGAEWILGVGAQPARADRAGRGDDRRSAKRDGGRVERTDDAGQAAAHQAQLRAEQAAAGVAQRQHRDALFGREPGRAARA